jgi:hypothetical protein
LAAGFYNAIEKHRGILFTRTQYLHPFKKNRLFCQWIISFPGVYYPNIPAVMKIPIFVLFILVLPLPGLSQNTAVDSWVERLKDNSKSQFISHYSIYRDIAKLDSVVKIKSAN